MANKSTIFPAYLRMEYDQGDAKARFKADLQDINRTIEAAAKRKGPGGAVDLGLGNLQQAKQDAQQFAQTAQQVLTAAERAARNLGGGYNEMTAAIGGTTRANYEAELATRSYLAAARATVTDANARVTAIDAEIRSLQILQTELNKAASARLGSSKPDLSFGVDRMAAGKASIDAAAVSMTTLEGVMGRVSREGQKSRQAMTDMATGSMEAARAADQLQREIDELRGSIDPLYYHQKKFDDELERANRLLRQGAISHQEHGRAVQVAGAQFAAAQRNAAGSTSNLRQATVQTGQQLQDIAISLYSGQRASTVFAQQLPQLAFALSNLEGSANKTHNRIGQFATFLSGPWGVAVGLGVGVLATLISSLFTTEQQSDSTKSATERLTKSLDFSAKGYSTLIEVVNQYNSSMVSTEAATYAAAEAVRQLAAEKIKEAKATLAVVEAQAAATNGRAANFGVNYTNDPGTIAVQVARNNIAKLEADLASATRAVTNFEIKGAVDPRVAMNQRFDRSQLQIERDAKERAAKAKTNAEKLAVEQEYKNRSIANEKARQQALESLQDTASKKKTRGPSQSSISNAAMSTTFIDPLNGRVTSGFGARHAPKSGASTNHRGIDIAAPVGTPVKATSGGVVSRVGNQPSGGGLWIELDHGAGTKTRYMHLSSQDVVKGQVVSQGEVIGKSGNTGNSTGPHLHYEVWRNGKPVDPRKAKSNPTDSAKVEDDAAEKARRAAEEAQRRAEQQVLNSQAIANEIANINSRWDEQPRLIDQSSKAVRDLDLIIAELNSKNNDDLPERAQRIAEAEAAKVKASQAVNNELSRYYEQGDQNLQLLELQAQGLNDQADIQREINQLDERLGIRRALETLYEQRDAQKEILADSKATEDARKAAQAELEKTNASIAVAEASQARMVSIVTDEFNSRKELNLEIARANRLMDEQVGLVRDVESSLRGVFTGQSSAGDFFKSIEASFQQYSGNRLFDSIFGDAFDMLEENMRKDTPLGKATGRAVKSFDGVSKATDDLTTAMENAFARIENIGKAPKAVAGVANDNDIVVNGDAPTKVALEARSAADLANQSAKAIVDPLLAGWSELLGPQFMQGLAGVLTGALAGYMRAGNVGGLIGGAKGIAGAFGAPEGVLAQFDKALGGAEKGGQINVLTSAILGKGKTSKTGAQIGGAIGSFIPIPGGDIIGSVVGSLIGGAFKKKKYGTATLTGPDSISVKGNKASYREQAEGLGGSVMDGLDRIAEALNADIGSFSTSIGLYKGKYRVSSTGRTGKLKGKYGDVTDFGDDEEAAIRFAIADAVKDGAVTGLRAATQRLLQQGDDVDAQLQKALDFEGVFNSLKELKDPVGAALDTLDKEFGRLIKLFGEAGASTEEYAQLEELYGIRRTQAIEEANSRVLSSLRGLLDELKIGDSGLSLRSRLSSAQAAYNPLASRVAAGDTTAYDDYASAARQLLDLQREVYGSTDAYFALLSQVTSLTQTRVDAESNVSSIAAGRTSPFDAIQVSTAVTDQTQILGSQLSAINDNIITLIETITANGGKTDGIFRIGNF